TTKPSGWVENSDSGNKLWLVFKGVQGTLNIQKMGLDGADLKSSTIGAFDYPYQVANKGKYLVNEINYTFAQPFHKIE
ncbi:hypothetical protein RFY08_05430, partial [Acinetobacter baumannii]|nr:hypothetical protein [Acinetobacter baumannii]